MQYSLVGTDDGSNITVFVSGRTPLVAHSSHPNFEKILEGALAGDESVSDLFDVALTAATRFERLTERVTTSNGRLYLDGVEVNNALSAQVVRFIGEGVEDWKPLVNFFENVQANQNEHSREQLYSWLNDRQFTITPEGNIVGYKGVQKKLDSDELVSINSGSAIVDGEVHSGYIPNQIGSVIEMPRDQVAHDPGTGCSTGLHVGTYEYANSFARGALLEVHVNPRDVVSVPTDCNFQKMRVCRYRVVGVIDAPHTVPVVGDYDDSLYDDEDYDDNYCDDCGEYIDSNDECGCDDAFEEAALYHFESATGEGYNPTTNPNVGDNVVAVGDVYQDLDKRRVGRTVTVESIDGDTATVKSLPSNVTVKVSVNRLQDKSRFRKV
jgi:hypothetical protein